jgi:hypothetical protein
MNIIKKMLKKAKKQKINYVIVHDGRASQPIKTKYKIICESPPLPIEYKQIEALTDTQILKLKKLIELRRRKNHITKQQNKFDILFNQWNNNQNQ